MENAHSDSASALIGRLFAVLLGPMLLLVTAARMVQAGGGWDHLAFTYFGILAGIVFGRWLDVRGGLRGTESTNRSDFYRFCAVTIGAGAGLWVLIRLFVHFRGANQMGA